MRGKFLGVGVGVVVLVGLVLAVVFFMRGRRAGERAAYERAVPVEVRPGV